MKGHSCFTDAYIIIWKNESKTDEEEIWTVETSLRKHVGDVTDLSWSKDSNYLLSSLVDSSAVLWDVKKVGWSTSSSLIACSGIYV